MDGWTDGRMDGRTENLPILQDFVPYRSRCPATAQLQPKNYIKRGKGTTDHMMPLGDWFPNLFILDSRLYMRVSVRPSVGKIYQPVAKRHHMVSGTLALLYTVFGL